MSQENSLRGLLRYWREMRGKSQFDLSLDTGVSQRHISFIESGRSVPSRETLMQLADALDVPLRDRNSLLLAAGYAPSFSDAAWNSSQMRSITIALESVLKKHEPFPAMVMDRYWNVLMANAAAPRFFNCFIDMAARARPQNMLHLMFDPKGMRPFIANWEELASALIQRVYREAVGRVIDEKTAELIEALRAYPGVESAWRVRERSNAAPAIMPFVPMTFVQGDRLLNYFSMVTTVGTPQTIAAQELRIECMFPADTATQAHHADLLSAAPPAT